MILIMIYDHKIYAHMSDLWIYGIIRRSEADRLETNNKPQLQQLKKKTFDKLTITLLCSQSVPVVLIWCSYIM